MRVQLIAQLVSVAVDLVTADSRWGLATALFALFTWGLRRQPVADGVVCVATVLLVLLLIA